MDKKHKKSLISIPSYPRISNKKNLKKKKYILMDKKPMNIYPTQAIFEKNP